MSAIETLSFCVPTAIEFGRGVSTHLGQKIAQLNARKPLIVTDKGIVQAGLIEPIRSDLAGSGLTVAVFDDVEANPRDVNCDAGGDLAKAHGADVIVGIGGGSPLDTAKAVAMLATNPGIVNDYFGYQKIEKPGLPMIALPTTAGTGSEVTMWSVITDTRGRPRVKDFLGSPLICPQAALLDPLLTVGLPPWLTASTGMDALTHAIEAYTSLPANPMTDAYALKAIGCISQNLLPAYANGDNLEAREQMLMGSLLAGIAFTNSALGVVHGFSETAGGLYDIPHGIANAIFLPYVMEYNLVARPDRFADIAEAMGQSRNGMDVMQAAYKSVEAVRQIARHCNIPSLKSAGIQKEDFEAICQHIIENNDPPCNPRKLTQEGLLGILIKMEKES